MVKWCCRVRTNVQDQYYLLIAFHHVVSMTICIQVSIRHRRSVKRDFTYDAQIRGVDGSDPPDGALCCR